MSLMDKLRDEIVALFERAGLPLPEADVERYRPMIEKYLESLQVLHSIDLTDEEVAGTFHPERVDD